ncbi:single-stranded-DNA-specific exonuclease RecJ [Cellvibrio polysaccharolyticus]|uniref:Single-stranded-DNA-specific exonuclease RecJ n=1 Tax=Cellvibrio polysaccharolyticus TaxID=2082724 RepID=A0A928V2Z3_9GAMM|nr:single-stranded-DNA-specific exonuclease RecJ [Cellvibrio polysaccharolyticus]MBE8717337.1 single-stranded-DNA-specific exonuclease RecJ [Cellvibrio polysaccharolyticus]
MKKIIRRRPLVNAAPLSADMPLLLQRVYQARGVTDKTQLTNQLSLLQKPQFKGMSEAVNIIADAIVAQARVMVIGDFDADGATSSALAVLALRAMGLQQVEFLVPNRFEFGYGLTPEIVAVAAESHPDLIITVDNGIASVEGVNAAKELGIAVVVTDHHLPGPVLPDADALVNPNQPGCNFPSKNLAGVGVIFYVMSALRAELRQMGWFEESGIAEPNMASFLDLVALGTVADVVPLDHNNRILVAQGLQRMRAGFARPGIKALLEVAGRQADKLVASDLGFIVGPRLNAAGRLDDMSLGIQCLLTDDEHLAKEMAMELDGLNRDRKAIESGMQQEALKMLQQLEDKDASSLAWGLCLFDDCWHQGVIGILASRLKDRYHRPVIIFADAGDGLIKGSARSVPGLHIRDALDAVAAKHSGLLQKFGGHAMAAGMTLNRENFDAFSKAFDEEVRRHLDEDDLTAVLVSDGDLQPGDFNLNIASQLREAGPWGQHFPEPLFDGEFFILQQRLVGEKHLKLVLSPDAQGQQRLDAIAFNIDRAIWPAPMIKKARLAYRLDVNTFRGQQTVQLMVEYIEALAE